MPAAQVPIWVAQTRALRTVQERVSGFAGSLLIAAEPLYIVIFKIKPDERIAVKVIGHFLLLAAVWTSAIVTPHLLWLSWPVNTIT